MPRASPNNLGLRAAVALAVVVLGCAAFRVDDARHGRSSDALSRALVSGPELPGHWARFRPRATRFDACGLKPPRTPNPKEQSSTAWAQNPTDGPLFGERIELYSKGKASVRLRELKTLPLPCEWDEFKTHWHASAEPPIGLGDDNWVYVIES